MIRPERASRAGVGAWAWMVAGRYLGEPGPPRRRLAWIALALGALAVAARAVAELWGQPVLPDIGLAPRPIGRFAGGASVACAALAALALLFWLLRRRFSMFAAISVFGVFLGTGALVIVLGVMSGFEGDLRGKILGTHAHATVRAASGPLRDPARVLREVVATPGVVAAQEMVESEAMLIGSGNQQVVVLRGVDPRAVARVTDLRRYLRGECAAGKLEYLADPAPLAAVRDREAALGPALERLRREIGAEAAREIAPDAGGGGAAAAGASPAPPPPAAAAALAPEAPAAAPPPPPRPVLPGLLVGCELAKSLRLYVGDDVRVVSPRGGLGPTGPMPRSRMFRVAGIFYSGMYEYDSKVAFAAVDAAREALGLRGLATAVEFTVRDPDRPDPVTARLGTRFGPGYLVQDWRETNRSLFAALKLEKIVMFVILTFIVMVASFSILITLIMTVLQKRREIAVLKAMGAPPRELVAIPVLQGLLIGALGTAMGLCGGVAVCLLLRRHGLGLDPEVYYIEKLPVNLAAADLAIIGAAALAISLLATLSPAWMTARLRPVEGLRYD